MTDEESKDAFMDLLSLRDSVESSKSEEGEDLQTIEDLTEEEIRSMAFTQILKTIGFNTTVLEELKDLVSMGADSDIATSYSMVSRANSDIIKTLSEFALQKERLKVQKEIKEMDIQGKKEINEHKFKLEDSGGGSKNTFILNNISREELLDGILKKRQEEEEPYPIKNITPKPKKITKKES